MNRLGDWIMYSEQVKSPITCSCSYRWWWCIHSTVEVRPEVTGSVWTSCLYTVHSQTRDNINI